MVSFVRWFLRMGKINMTCYDNLVLNKVFQLLACQYLEGSKQNFLALNYKTHYLLSIQFQLASHTKHYLLHRFFYNHYFTCCSWQHLSCDININC